MHISFQSSVGAFRAIWMTVYDSMVELHLSQTHFNPQNVYLCPDAHAFQPAFTVVLYATFLDTHGTYKGPVTN